MANEIIIRDFLLGKGLTQIAVFGLMGNLKAESGLNPKNLQNSFERKIGLTDETYTIAVDSGAYGNFNSDSAGYGLAQWTSSGRKTALLEYAKKQGSSIGDLKMQLEFLYKELTGSYRSVLNGINSAKSVREASDLVLTKFERPKDQSESVKKYRAGLGESLMAEFGRGVNPYPIPTQVIRRDRDEVRWLQSALNLKGYSLEVDGVWGKKLTEAVLDFQKKNGLLADGEVGSKTRAKLV